MANPPFISAGESWLGGIFCLPDLIYHAAILAVLCSA